MRVWIEQEYCTGDGLCAELCPEVFAMDESEGLAYVKPEAAASGQAQGAASPGVELIDGVEDGVLDAQAQCAGECIFVAR